MAQLDIDMCMLLDCLGDSEFLAQNNDSPELLYLLLQSHMLAFSADVESNGLQAPQHRIAAGRSPLVATADVNLEPETGGTDRSMDVVDTSDKSIVVASFDDLNSTIISNLTARADFTLAAFERLCVAVGESVALPLQADKPSSVNCVSDAKEIFGERGVLIERAKSLSLALADLHIKVHLAEGTNASLHRDIYRKKEGAKTGNGRAADIAEATTSSSSSSAHHENSGSETTDDVVSDSRRLQIKSEYDKIHSMGKELSEQFEDFMKSLKHSELAKTKLELEINNRITKPVDTIEENILMQQKALDDMNTKHKETIFGMLEEINVAKEKITTSKQKLIEIENKTVGKCKEAIKLSEAGIQEKRAMLEEARKHLVCLKAERRLEWEYADLRNILDASQRMADKESATLQEKIRKAEGNKKLAEFHLETSRERIKCLELLKNGKVGEANNKLQLLSKRKFVLPSSLVSSKASAATPAKKVVVLEEGECSDGEDEDAECASNSTSAVTVTKPSPGDNYYAAATKHRPLSDKEKCVLSATQMRGVDMETELGEMRAFTDQLINEIEEVTLQSSQAQEQAVYIKEKLLDTSKHVDIMDSNIILKSELESAQKKLEAVVGSYKKLQSSYDKNTTTIYNMRQTDIISADEINKLRKQRVNSHEKPQRDLEEDSRLRSDDKKAVIIESLVNFSEKRNTLLRSRQEQLGKAARREEALCADCGVGSSEARSSSKGQSDTMLDITLKMIRCSVCNARNKSMIISRCFHLLCKECVDVCKKSPKNMKCPTCGERFFKDDIKAVYFTS